MKLQRSIYIDELGNEWIIERQSIERVVKGGSYSYWMGECDSLRKSFREPLKRTVIKAINNLVTEIKNRKHEQSKKAE